MIKKLRINTEDLTQSKHRRLHKFCEKGNSDIDIENIIYNSETKLTNSWINLGNGWGSCWLPIDGALMENEMEKLKNIKIIEDHKGYKVLLFFKKIKREITGNTYNNKTMSVASVRVLERINHGEIPREVQKIMGSIPLSRVYKIMVGKYIGCYAIKTRGYWSPPLFRTTFDCGVYDAEGVLMCA